MAEFIGNAFEWIATNTYNAFQFIIDTWGVWAGVAAFIVLKRFMNHR